VRTASTFSFEDLTKLNINLMTYYRKRTASEREVIARKLRNTSLVKRKKRRAIRRKPKRNPSGVNSGDVDIYTPHIRSTAGSVCGDSICGGSSIGEIISANPSPIPTGARGSLEVPRLSVSFEKKHVDNNNKNSSNKKSKSKSPKGRSTKVEIIKADSSPRTGGSGIVCSNMSAITVCGEERQVILDVGNLGTGDLGFIGCSTSSGCGGGVRVNAKVIPYDFGGGRAISGQDCDRFILETEEQTDGPAPGHQLGDTVMDLMGMKVSTMKAEKLTPKEDGMMKELGLNPQPSTFAELGEFEMNDLS